MSEAGKTPEDLIKGLPPEVNALIKYVNKMAEDIDVDPTLSARQDYWHGILTNLDEVVAAGQISPEHRQFLIATLLTRKEAGAEK